MPHLKAINVLSVQKCTKYFAKKYITETMASTPASYVADLEICLNPMKFDSPFFFRIEHVYFLRSSSHTWISLLLFELCGYQGHPVCVY